MVVVVRTLLIVMLVLAGAAMLVSEFGCPPANRATPQGRENIASTRIEAVLFSLLEVAILIFFMVVGWRAMRGIESIAESAARVAANSELPSGVAPPTPREGGVRRSADSD
jgi:hypothetical protein